MNIRIIYYLCAFKHKTELKKLVSISLIFIFLFQFIGYYFVNMGLRYQAKTEIAKRLDAEHYTESETVTFKIPLNVPYGVDSKDYERVNGEFEHDGEFYKLVKQKLLHDTLYVVCINNKTEKELVTEMADFMKLSTDLPTSSKDHSKVLTNLLKDYVSQPAIELGTLSGWSFNRTFFSQPSDRLLETDFSILSPPPRISC